MKDIIVEFTEYGAIVHKDAAIIASLKDVPHCFFNPDLSKVSGVSPSFWALNEAGEIIKASPEEIQRRNDYLTSKPAATPSLKTTLDTLKQEMFNEMESRNLEIKDDLHSSINEGLNNVNKKYNDLNISVNFIANQTNQFKKLTTEELNQFSKQLYMYKIALIVSTVIALIGAIK